MEHRCTLTKNKYQDLSKYYPVYRRSRDTIIRRKLGLGFEFLFVVFSTTCIIFKYVVSKSYLVVDKFPFMQKLAKRQASFL